MRNLCVSIVLSAFVLVLPFIMGARQSKVPKPLLDARYIQSGCCSRNFDFTYLRVFADGKVEWDEEDLKTHSFAAHRGALSGKQLNAVQSAIDKMKGLAKNYAANGAKRNIDDMLSFAITASEGGKDYHTEILFGLPVDAENYSELRTPVRAVACTLTILRSDLSHEKIDLTFCRKYFVGR